MSWFLARRLITAVLAVCALALAACSSTHTQATPAPMASPSPTSTASTPPPPLISTASVTRRHPITGTTVVVRVAAHGQKRSTRVWFSPRQPPPPPAPPTTAPAPPPAPSGCYPQTSSGHCYEPGEFCPHADAGMRGIAGDGEAIICEDNNGLRWEPA